MPHCPASCLPHAPAADPEAADWPVLDLRDLPAPEPLERALAHAATLAAGEGVVILTPRFPTPLLDLLADWGLRCTATECADGTARVVVEQPPDPAPAPRIGHGKAQA